MATLLWCAACAASAACAACAAPAEQPRGDPRTFRWSLPAGIPAPSVPADNPMSDAKVALGRRLFYDPRLSANGAFSCSSCHRQAKAFADGRNRPFGVTGQLHPRNSMALANVAYLSRYGWADPSTTSLEAQARIPLFGETPVELGLRGREDTLLVRLRAVALYDTLFRAAFGSEAPPITVDHVVRAIAAFERTMISLDAPYDRDARRTGPPLPAAARRGAALFFGERLRCARCHSGPFFTNAARAGTASAAPPEYFNTGLYNVGGTGAYPAPNTGLFAVTGVAADMGRFRVPSLRNVAVSYPYMHDGSVATLEDAIDHYAAGGRTVALGPGAGIGRTNPYKSPLVAGFAITAAERGDLVAFLQALTDSTFLTDPKFSNPWIVR